jgi:hypothetical protein
MALRKKPFLVIFGTILLLWGLAAASAAAPRLEVEKTTHDFGEVFEDKELTYTFLFKNTGDAPLEIRNIDSDCACTAADYDRRIPPGGAGRLTLTIEPYSVMRQFQKNTTVTFNDPARSQVVFRMQGYAKPFIEIQPSHIIRFRGMPRKGLSDQVRFISHLPGPWEITGFKTNIPQFIDVDLKAEEPGRVYVLTVHNKSTQAGRYAGKIDLTTTSTQRPRLIVRVFADFSPPSGVPY